MNLVRHSWIHPSIILTAFSRKGHGSAGANPSCNWARVRAHPAQNTIREYCKLKHDGFKPTSFLLWADSATTTTTTKPVALALNIFYLVLANDWLLKWNPNMQYYFCTFIIQGIRQELGDHQTHPALSSGEFALYHFPSNSCWDVFVWTKAIVLDQTFNIFIVVWLKSMFNRVIGSSSICSKTIQVVTSCWMHVFSMAWKHTVAQFVQLRAKTHHASQAKILTFDCEDAITHINSLCLCRECRTLHQHSSVHLFIITSTQ